MNSSASAESSAASMICVPGRVRARRMRMFSMRRSRGRGTRPVLTRADRVATKVTSGGASGRRHRRVVTIPAVDDHRTGSSSFTRVDLAGTRSNRRTPWCWTGSIRVQGPDVVEYRMGPVLVGEASHRANSQARRGSRRSGKRCRNHRRMTGSRVEHIEDPASWMPWRADTGRTVWPSLVSGHNSRCVRNTIRSSTTRC